MASLTSKGEHYFEVEQIAFKVFGKPASLEWLQKAHPMLDGKTPLEIAKTPSGAQRVKELLIAIQYGHPL